MAAKAGSVQSLERSFELLEHMADSGGEVALSQLATASGLPLPTIHRLMRTLVNLGYVRQEPSRRYALGPRLIRLGESAGRLLGSWSRPHLGELVDSLGETANLAMLEGDEIVYVAQVPSKHSMRMFTEVGRRVFPHCTGVGKVLLAQLPNDQVKSLLARTGMPAMTPHTITGIRKFLAALDQVRADGFAVDEGEQEVGVRCVAVHIPGAPTLTAISISGPAGRMTDDAVRHAVPVLQRVARELGAEISYQESTA